MMWVCRAGQKSVFAEYYFATNRIYIPWDGFKTDLSLYVDRTSIKELVSKEKGDVSRTSISNWSGQLYSFCWEMMEGDYVLIPYKNSKKYAFARIVGGYEFDCQNEKQLWHSRRIEIVIEHVPSDIFSQTVRYSLGAYRTIFKAKHEDEILSAIKAYRSKK